MVLPTAAGSPDLHAAAEEGPKEIVITLDDSSGDEAGDGDDGDEQGKGSDQGPASPTGEESSAKRTCSPSPPPPPEAHKAKRPGGRPPKGRSPPETTPAPPAGKRPRGRPAKSAARVRSFKEERDEEQKEARTPGGNFSSGREVKLRDCSVVLTDVGDGYGQLDGRCAL